MVRDRRSSSTRAKAKRPAKGKRKVQTKVKGSFIGLRIPDDLKTRLEILGSREGKSTTDVLKELIEKHIDTKEALTDEEKRLFKKRSAARPTDTPAADVANESDDAADDDSSDDPVVWFDPTTGESMGHVTFEILLDDMLRYQRRLKELDSLIAAEKGDAWFGGGNVPAHLKLAKTVCEKKIKLVSDKMKALFPDVAEADEEKYDDFGVI